MALSCVCDYDDFEEWFDIDKDFSAMKKLVRRKRCFSCGEFINDGDDVLEAQHYRYPKSDIEERICGTEIPLANVYFCKECGEIYLNLDAIGYCVPIGPDLHDILKEYWEMTGFDPAKYVANVA